MNMLMLTEICDFQGGTQPPKEQWINKIKDGYTRMLQIRDFTQGKNEKEYVKITNTLKMCNEDDILIARYGASVGRILTGLSGAYNVAIIKSIPNTSKILKRYLFYYFNSDYFQTRIKNVGSRAAQAGFNKEDLKDFKILIPTLEQQQQTIEILDKSQELIDKRKEQLEALDELVKSRFIEMFGDPARNPKGWEMTTISEITTDVRYGTSKPAVEGGKYPYLRMNNITYSGYLNLENLKYIDIEGEELEKCIVRKGDVLFNRTNSAELIGKTCVFNIEEPMIIAGYIIRIRLNKEVLPIYLSMFLNSNYGKGLLRGMAKGAVNQANINAQELKSINIAIPPIELQNQFSTFVSQVDKLKFEAQKSLTEMENNFNSLMQKAFSGELFN